MPTPEMNPETFPPELFQLKLDIDLVSSAGTTFVITKVFLLWQNPSVFNSSEKRKSRQMCPRTLSRRRIPRSSLSKQDQGEGPGRGLRVQSPQQKGLLSWQHKD